MEIRLSKISEALGSPSSVRYFRAPGRVNIIGEHTDYNNGFVLPFAIDRDTVTGAVPRVDAIVRCYALDVGETLEFDLRDSAVMRRGNWRDYVEGTVRCLQKRFGFQKGAELAFASTVPMGAGLSSSAALEVSVGFAILGVHGCTIDRREVAFASQEAEHLFVGTRSGLMDQFASTFGEAGHALLLDCRDLQFRSVDIELPGTSFVICDSKVRHNLASSEYNLRREQCEEAVRKLQAAGMDVSSLRDVSPGDLNQVESELPETVFRRVKHVVTENDRTLQAARAFDAADPAAVGMLMSGSHESLRDDYEVSCAELDVLVSAVQKLDGVFGSRMTGGGFGGCTVSLVRTDAINALKESVSKRYSKDFNILPGIYVFQAGAGASEIPAGAAASSPIDA